MITKWIKRGILAGLGLMLVGTLFFGKDVLSYVRSSGKWARSAVKDSVPVEFELRRARDLLEEVIPEMHTNIGLIATEEVEVATLKKEVADAEESIENQQSKINQLRNHLKSDKNVIEIRGKEYTREQIKADLAWRFERFKEAQLVLTGKKKLLENRTASLNSAVALLEKTKARKSILANKIESLETQHRLIKASAVDSGVSIDNSKIAKAEKLITEIKKRLNVAERILTHESKFVETIPFDEPTEQELTEQIDNYFKTEYSKSTI